MFQAPLNKLVIKVASKFLMGPNRFLREDVMNPSSRINPADYVQIVGEVVSIPRKIGDRVEYAGYSTVDIRPGDTAIFSYQVIYNYTVIEDEVIFKNMVYYNGEEFFIADIQHIYAVIRNKQIRMQNGYVMIAEPEKPLIILPTEIQKSSTQSIVTHIGRCLTTEKPIDVMPGDTVYFNQNKLMTYQMNNKSFGVLRQSDIFGKKISNYEKFASVI